MGSSTNNDLDTTRHFIKKIEEYQEDGQENQPYAYKKSTFAKKKNEENKKTTKGSINDPNILDEI